MHLPLSKAPLPPLLGKLEGPLPPSSSSACRCPLPSLVASLAFSSSSDSSEGESYKKKAVQTGINMNLFHKAIKRKRRGNSKLPVLLSPSTSPSGSSSFSLNCANDFIKPSSFCSNQGALYKKKRKNSGKNINYVRWSHCPSYWRWHAKTRGPGWPCGDACAHFNFSKEMDVIFDKS